ncbi:MAG: Veg family protein [Atopobiaceae bacterium]|nr:Veg family protein [Atopobiaceae bacterium]
MENDIPPVNRIDTIRDELMRLQGERLKVRANMGRSRIVERTGTLVMAHPSLFVVEVEERRGRKSRQSYQYVDVLTGTVELYDTDTGERILNFAPADAQLDGGFDDGDDFDDED